MTGSTANGKSVGKDAVGAISLSLGWNKQHSTIAKLIQHESDEATNSLVVRARYNDKQAPYLSTALQLYDGFLSLNECIEVRSTCYWHDPAHRGRQTTAWPPQHPIQAVHTSPEPFMFSCAISCKF
ncbi:unnamed protein product [Peronospora belbahrii]|uniref:Uncharacterized protein n=1 Tax=Peronospora belbahrii TaxID=622444 RepID=A0ABN8CS63_9STRA|nr:unnamed protein product [Peronospora belbahrii]